MNEILPNHFISELGRSNIGQNQIDNRKIEVKDSQELGSNSMNAITRSEQNDTAMKSMGSDAPPIEEGVEELHFYFVDF